MKTAQPKHIASVYADKPRLYLMHGRWHVMMSRYCKLSDCRAARLWVDARNALHNPRLELVP